MVNDNYVMARCLSEHQNIIFNEIIIQTMRKKEKCSYVIGSDQAGHSRTLIRAFVARLQNHLIL